MSGAALEHPFVHWCDHPGCKAWGTYGRGCSPRRGERGRWHCLEHLPASWAAELGATIETGPVPISADVQLINRRGPDPVVATAPPAAPAPARPAAPAPAAPAGPTQGSFL